MNYLDLLLKVLGASGILIGLVLTAYNFKKKSSNETDQTTIKSLQSAVAALELERDLFKQQGNEQQKQIALLTGKIDTLEKIISTLDPNGPLARFAENEEKMMVQLDRIEKKIDKKMVK